MLTIQVVGDDVGDAGYSEYGETDSVGGDPSDTTTGIPGVVSVTRALGATGFASAVTGPFDVRIILTEEPAAFTCLPYYC